MQKLTAEQIADYLCNTADMTVAICKAHIAGSQESTTLALEIHLILQDEFDEAVAFDIIAKACSIILNDPHTVLYVMPLLTKEVA